MAKQKRLPPSFPTFISKHSFSESDVVARVKAIDWFAKVGQPADFDLTFAVTPVTTWAAAMKASRSLAWDRVILEAQNQLTLALHDRNRERYRDWNRITDDFKRSVVTPLSKKVWKPFQRAHYLDDNFVHCVQWNILTALMENAYIDAGHGAYFFLELLTVYEAGRIPCGWRGRWPGGTLVVY